MFGGESTTTSAIDPATAPRHFRWTREAYYHLHADGLFEGRRVELIDGEIIEMPAQKNGHAWSIAMAEQLLRSVAGPGYWVRSQMPLHLSQWSDPEPDLAVVEGSIASWKGRDHPQTARLVVEVSDTSLAFDRRTKQAVYAAAAIAEFWIVNLLDRQLEVFRNPLPNAEDPRSSRYQSVQHLTTSQSIQPLAFPEATIRVGDLIG